MPNYSHFLVGPSSSSPESLPDVVTKLRDASALFCAAWNSQNFSQAQRASQDAMRAFDHICNSFLRARDDAKNHGTYSGPLAQHMARKIGRLASPVTRAEQHSNAGHPANWGNGCLPARTSAPPKAKFDVALNKIKHRIDKHSNFRINGGRHFLMVAGDWKGEPEYIFEFDVIEFCDLCDLGCAAVA
jgi:hypothetical protein